LRDEGGKMMNRIMGSRRSGEEERGSRGSEVRHPPIGGRVGALKN